jgi:hypothetical protein
MKVHKPSKSFILAVAAVALLLPLTSMAAAGSIDSANKYAWGSGIGWVNFNPTNGNVAVSDAGLSGSAWGENYGWINLNPTASGVKNDGTGVLSGYAWGENTGYIDFSGVRINAQGIFTGTATGDIVGSLTFDCTNCKVTTTWRPSTGVPIVSPTPPSVSVGVGSGYLPPAFTVNGGASSTQSPTVTLSFSTPPNVSLFSITNESGAGSSTATSSYQSVLAWNLCAGLTSCPPGAYSLTVRFLDAQNNTLGTVSHSIVYFPASPSGTPQNSATTMTTSSSPSVADLLQQLAALQAQLQALLREVAARGIAATQTASSSFQFTRDLKFGMAGDDVNKLQLFLIRENTGPAARKLAAHGTTKNFATLTLNALIEFQKKAGIKPAVGYFGPITRAEVNNHMQ